MKILKTFEQFLNEAGSNTTKQPVAPAPAPQPEEDDFNFADPNAVQPAPAAPVPGSPADPAAPLPVDPNAPVGTADPNAVPPADGSAPPPPGGASPAGGSMPPPPSGGSSPLGGSSSMPPPPSSGDTGPGENAPEEAPEPGDNKSQVPGEYIPPVNRFKVVLMDKGSNWDIKYPDGGGVKKMEGYEIEWKDLNKWLDANNLGKKKQEIAEYLLGETEKLDDETKIKLKAAIKDKSVAEDRGKTDVEFDDDNTAYVSDVNTVIVNL